MNKEDINLEKFMELTDKLEKAEKLLQEREELLEGLKKKDQESQEQFNKYRDQIDRLRDQNTELFLRVAQPIEEPKVQQEIQPKQEETITLDDLF